MTAFGTHIGNWLLHSALGGGILLLAVCWLMCCTRQPVRRQRLGELGVLAALVLAGLAFTPRWLIVPVPVLAEATAVVADAEVVRPAAEPAANTDPIELHDQFLFEFVPAAAPEPPLVEQARPKSRPAAGADSPAWRLSDAIAVLQTAGVACFALGAGLFLARWMIGMIGLARLLRNCQPAPHTLLCAMQSNDANLTGVRVLLSPRLHSPISCGLLHPTIVLPAAISDQCDQSKLRWIVAHELAHLRRGDAWSSLLLALGQMAFFYLPWYWWVRRQVRLCQEYVADAAAIQTADGPLPADYAEFLLSLTKVPAVPLGATGVSGQRSDLYRRLSMLLQNPMRVELCCPQRWLLLAGAPLLAAAVLLSGISISTVAAGQQAKEVKITPPAPAAAPAPPAQKTPVPPQPVQPSLPKPPVKSKEPVQPQTPSTPKTAEPTAKSAAIEQLERALKDLEGQPGRPELDHVRIQIELAMRHLKEMQKRTPGAAFEFEIKPFVPGQFEVEVRPFGFAVPPGIGQVDVIRRAPFDRGRLGVSVDRPSDILADQLDLPRGEGLIITDVVAKSVADKAGFKTNDILLELNKKPVKSDPVEFARQIMEMKGEAAFDVVVLRKGKKMTMKDVKLPEPQRVESLRPAFPPGPGFPFRGGPGTSMTTVMRDKETFNANHREGSLSIRLIGKMADGKVQVERIHIQDGPQVNTYESLEAVPAEQRDRVNRLLDIARTSVPPGDPK